MSCPDNIKLPLIAINGELLYLLMVALTKALLGNWDESAIAKER